MVDMNIDLSFLNTIGQRLSDYFKPYKSYKASFEYPENKVPEDQKITKLPPALGPAPAQAIQAPPTPTPVPAQPSQFTMPDEATLRDGLSRTYGAENPIIPNLALYLQAASQLPSNIDPMLPIILALRETQGGEDLLDPNKNAKLGKNNVFNIRGTQDGVRKFVNYPDLATALMGGQNGPDVSQGLIGTLNNDAAYSKFRETGDLANLFEKYSPPVDSNGDLAEQVQNYMWIRNHVLGIPQ